MPKYLVLSPIKHNGILYRPDGRNEVLILLDEPDAARLRATGSIGEAVAADGDDAVNDTNTGTSAGAADTDASPGTSTAQAPAPQDAAPGDGKKVIQKPAKKGGKPGKAKG